MEGNKLIRVKNCIRQKIDFFKFINLNIVGDPEKKQYLRSNKGRRGMHRLLN